MHIKKNGKFKDFLKFFFFPCVWLLVFWTLQLHSKTNCQGSKKLAGKLKTKSFDDHQELISP